jgi:hypothetical protein
MALARKHRLTVYDAGYLELALRQDLPLATLDADLIDAARAEAVPLIGDDRPSAAVNSSPPRLPNAAAGLT